MTNPEPPLLPKGIGIRRSPSLLGIEVLDSVDTDHRLDWFHTAFGLGLPTTWRGQVRYRGWQQSVGKGMALCTTPGELAIVPRIEHVGTFNAVMIEVPVFHGYAGELGVDTRAVEWRMLAGEVSPSLARRFARFLELLGPRSSPMELQSSLIDVLEQATRELIVGGRRSVAGVGSAAVKRMREMLHSSDGWALDLDTLASGAGMSRFQALRAFKQRYGLPPHAYQICVQLSLARTLLRNGQSVADVAHACGFADQSHFGRTFKRVYGITPGTYARAGLPVPRNSTEAFGRRD